MKSPIAIALATANLVAGHATFQSFAIDGIDQGHHFAVQTSPLGASPVMNPASPDMVCKGGKATAGFVEVAAGSNVTMQWHGRDPVTISKDEPIATSHKGPVMVYIAPAKGNGKGAVWTKLYEDGYSNGKWGVDRFIANKGAITITLPDLADGTYLIRPEIIALHEANSRGGAQFYNRCGQIKIKGGSKSLPRTGTDLTKAYLATDPGVLCNIYYGLKSYQIPGPPVWDGAGSSTSPAAGTKPAASDSAAPTRTASVSKTRVSTTAKTGTTTSVSVIPTKTASVSKTPTPTAVKSDAAPSSCSESSADLPETFTITSFIAWLKKQTDTSGKVRHARAFRL